MELETVKKGQRVGWAMANRSFEGTIVDITGNKKHSIIRIFVTTMLFQWGITHLPLDPCGSSRMHQKLLIFGWLVTP